jgi:hypothetical protein
MSQFNSADTPWSSLTVVVAGRTLTGIRGISYKKAKEKELLHAAGSKPIGIQHGNITFEGTMTLLKTEFDALLDEARRQNIDLLDLTGDIVVNYKAGSRNRTDRIKNFEFTEYEKGLEQNDKFMSIEMPIIFLDLEENV